MVVTIFCDTLDELQTLSAEIVNAAAAEGVKMIGERVAAKAHYLSQHPGNQPKRVRASAITNRNFADFAAIPPDPARQACGENPLGQGHHLSAHPRNRAPIGFPITNKAAPTKNRPAGIP